MAVTGPPSLDLEANASSSAGSSLGWRTDTAGMQEERKALAAAVTGSALWGLSGTAAQVVVQSYVFPVWGLVTVRMLGAAFLLQNQVLRPRFLASYRARRAGP